MDQPRVAVLDLLAKKPGEMMRVDHNHAVELVALDGSDPSFRGPIPPRGAKGCFLWLDAKA
ncbi:MAG: hypothetical protein JRG86_22285 [Deltaproteobacteria bacterium]|jgi:hypothetical protein|nr:hypothetical protein [Deltaproteobacteria bacterium]